MANIAALNRMMRTPTVYWENRGFSEGFERANYANETGAAVDCSKPSGLPNGACEAAYRRGFRNGCKYAYDIHTDWLNGELS